MATTTTMTTIRPTTAPATTTMSKADFPASITATTCACPSCGHNFTPPPLLDTHAALLQAQRQIADLQSQVRILNQKATAAVDRWADYEDELSRLRAGSTTSSSTATTTTHSDTPNRSGANTNISSTTSPRSSFLGAGANRISQLLSPRSGNNNNSISSAANASISNKPLPGSGQLSPTTAQTPGSPAWRASRSTSSFPSDPEAPIGPTNKELLAALGRERKLREEAEAKVEETSKEVEELSVSLFEQANEMVATERRARAKLEERVEVLERRDGEKKVRLDRLEGAMGRLESVKAFLAEGSAPRGKKVIEGGKDEFDVA